MTDLVKRLRDTRGWVGGQIPADMAEAADLIEELVSENAHLRAAAEAYAEMAQAHAKAGGSNVMRRQMEMRRLKIRAEAAEAEVEESYIRGMAAGQAAMPKGTFQVVDGPEVAELRAEVDRLRHALLIQTEMVQALRSQLAAAQEASR